MRCFWRISRFGLPLARHCDELKREKSVEDMRKCDVERGEVREWQRSDDGVGFCSGDSLPEVNHFLQVYRSRNSNKNLTYKYRFHEEQCQGEHKKTETLQFNPNLILAYTSKKENKNLVFGFLID